LGTVGRSSPNVAQSRGFLAAPRAENAGPSSKEFGFTGGFSWLDAMYLTFVPEVGIVVFPSMK
jgi:hypothetical protein